VSDDLRSRLYSQYVSGGQARPPVDLAGLAPRAPYLRRLVDRHLPGDRDAAIFDVGCGYGALLHFAAEAGYHNLRGVDGSPEQVATAADLGIPGVEQGDLLESLAALPAASQDAILALDVLEHFDKHELVRAVDAVHRALRPGGRWILHVPNAESPFFGAIRYGDLTHELAFTRESLAQLVLASGFQGITCFEDEPVAHGVKSWLRLLIWRGIRLGLRVWVAAETGEAGGNAVFSRNLLAVVEK